MLGFVPGELKADPALTDAWAAGEAMTADEAVAYALGERDLGRRGEVSPREDDERVDDRDDRRHEHDHQVEQAPRR